MRANRGARGKVDDRARISRHLVLVAEVLACALLAPGCAGDKEAPARKLYLVVTREAFVEAAQPLIRKRREEGFEVVVSLQPPDQAIRSLSPRRPELLLLIGDEQEIVNGRVVVSDGARAVIVADDEDDAADRCWRVPSKWETPYRWREGQWPVFASDAAWGDLDGDRVPDIPVGRLPVRTAAELSRIVDKILEYERQPPSLNDLRLAIVAGDPMNDPQRDGVIWALLGTLATDFVVGGVKADGPPWAQAWVLSASGRQPFRGWPPDYPDLLSERLRDGGFLALLMGHGSQQCFCFTRFEGQSIDYTAQAAAERLAEGKPGPPLVIQACGCGNFTGADDSIAESLLRLPAGPVAVMAATTTANTLTDYLVARSVLQVSREGGVRRLGEFWLQSQRRMPVERNRTIERILLGGGTGYVGEKPDLDKLRRDHQLLYVLLGDPATHLRLPRRLEARASRDGARWRWQVQRPPDAAKLHVSFRPQLAQPLAAPPVEDRHGLRALLAAANEVFAFQELPAPPPDGPWEGAIDQNGTLRLVAFTPEALYVAVLDIGGL